MGDLPNFYWCFHCPAVPAVRNDTVPMRSSRRQICKVFVPLKGAKDIFSGDQHFQVFTDAGSAKDGIKNNNNLL
jgi:hypothetical protein